MKAGLMPNVVTHTHLLVKRSQSICAAGSVRSVRFLFTEFLGSLAILYVKGSLQRNRRIF
jgi:hypothetical protein